MNALKDRDLKSCFLNVMKQYQDVFLFLVVLFVCHFFWKYSISFNEDLRIIDLMWFGVIDISAPFSFVTQKTAEVVYAIFQFLGVEVSMNMPQQFLFPNGNKVTIVWACNGLKQMFLFACIILFARGSWTQKLWFIPLGVFICFLFNIVRLLFLIWLVKDYRHMFDFYHEYVTKYLFYAVMFLLWVWWNERLKFSAPTKKVY